MLIFSEWFRISVAVPVHVAVLHVHLGGGRLDAVERPAQPHASQEDHQQYR